MRLTTKAFYAGDTLHAKTTSHNVAHLRKSSFNSGYSVITNKEAPATRIACFLSGSLFFTLLIALYLSINSFPISS